MKMVKRVFALLMALMLLCSMLVLPLAAEAAPPVNSAPTEGTEGEPTPDPKEEGLSFHPENFAGSLAYMGTGMIGIFLVIGIIILATVLLNRVFSTAPKNKN